MNKESSKKPKKPEEPHRLAELIESMDRMADQLWEQRHLTEGQSWHDLCDIVALLRGFQKHIKG